MKRTQNRHATAKTSHFSVFGAFKYIKFNCEVITARFIVYLITFIDVCRVTPPTDEVVNGSLAGTWLLCTIALFTVTMILFQK